MSMSTNKISVEDVATNWGASFHITNALQAIHDASVTPYNVSAIRHMEASIEHLKQAKATAKDKQKEDAITIAVKALRDEIHRLRKKVRRGHDKKDIVQQQPKQPIGVNATFTPVIEKDVPVPTRIVAAGGGSGPYPKKLLSKSAKKTVKKINKAVAFAPVPKSQEDIQKINDDTKALAAKPSKKQAAKGKPKAKGGAKKGKKK